MHFLAPPKADHICTAFLSALIVLTLLSKAAFSGGYYNHINAIDYYDKTSGLYYKSVTPKGKKSGFMISKAAPRHISNLFLFDPASNKSKLLFPVKDKSRKITFILHEKKFQQKSWQKQSSDYAPSITKKGQMIEFHRYGNVTIHNNNTIEKRPMRDHMLVGVQHIEKKTTEIWSCKKDGSGLKKLVILPQKASWHIDLKALKFRTFSPHDKKGYIVQNFDW